MSSNFNINPNFQANFDNSIQEYNKIFNNSVNETKNFEIENNNSSFEKIFNDISNSATNNQNPIKAQAEFFVGMDSINAQKIDSLNSSNSSPNNLSPTAKMAQDIQAGFSNGIKGLNAISKQAEDDFETFASGGDISIHDVMISAQKSSLAMQMAIQLRNQMINAYSEFKNLQF